MNPRRGFLRSLGVATLAVALDVLPRFGVEHVEYGQSIWSYVREVQEQINLHLAQLVESRVYGRG